MKYALVMIGILGLGMVIVFIWGLSLPQEKTYTKEFTFRSPVENVWNIVNDLPGQVKWRTDVKEIKIISNSPEVWIEYPKQGPEIKFRTKTKEKGKLWEMEIIENPSLSGNWIGTFDPTADGGTIVKFIEKPSIINPFMRVFAHLIIDMDNAMELYLENLANALGEKYESAK